MSRFNQGKTRVDLAPAFAQEQYCRVLTAGAAKYGDTNWRQGMKWSIVLASLERHLLAIKSGKDYDEETGLLHAAHVMCNAAFLIEYYQIYPQGDDRPHHYLRRRRIGLVVEALCGCNKLSFEPAFYVASDGCLLPDHVPPAPIYGREKAKIDLCHEAKVDLFVETCFEDFVALNNAGICCYLFTTEQNKHYNVGHKRLEQLKQLE